MAEKVLFTENSHHRRQDGFTRSSDGQIDIKLPQPHPTAEKLFAAARSACFISAIELAATRKKIKLPSHPAVDAGIDLVLASDAFFLMRAHCQRAGRTSISLELVEMARHLPLLKATHGNINVETTVV